MTNSQTTGADGKAEFVLPYGDYTVSVVKDGFVSATESVGFRSNHKNFSVVMTESPIVGTGTVTVTCMDYYNVEPVANAQVHLSTDIPTSENWTDVIIARASTDSNGVCTLKTIDPTTYSPTETDAELDYGTYYVYVDSMEIGHFGTLVVDSAEENVTLQLYPIATISVLDNDNDDPISEAVVTATTTIDGVSTSFLNITDYSGDAQLYMPYCDGEEIVEYTLTASKTGYTFQTEPPTTFDFNGGTTEYNVYMNKIYATVTITVMDGNTVCTTCPFVALVQDGVSTGFEDNADENGVVVFDEMVPFGEYTIEVDNVEVDTLTVDSITETKTVQYPSQAQE